MARQKSSQCPRTLAGEQLPPPDVSTHRYSKPAPIHHTAPFSVLLHATNLHYQGLQQVYMSTKPSENSQVSNWCRRLHSFLAQVQTRLPPSQTRDNRCQTVTKASFYFICATYVMQISDQMRVTGINQREEKILIRILCSWASSWWAL